MLNEHLCLARDSGRSTCGRVPGGALRGRAAIAVERYDGLQVGGQWIRIHQEDFCQVLASYPRPNIRSRAARAPAMCWGDPEPVDAGRGGPPPLHQALVLNWAIEGTDAHAKNYSARGVSDGQDTTGPEAAPERADARVKQIAPPGCVGSENGLPL